MKKIVCELCECMEFTKEGGMFVCNGCGTKYTVEEVRGMMREVESAAPAVASAAPVGAMPMRNPNEQQIDNMLILAATAFEANNNKEAETYCNQVIALDATAYKAWLLKGKAVGWQSTIQNPRITEAAHAFAQAIDCAPEDEKENIKEEAIDQLKRLGLACMLLRKNRFSKYPDNEELVGFFEEKKNLLDALLVLLSKGIAAGIPEGYENEIAHIMNQAAVAGFKKVRENYNNKDKPYIKDLQKALDEVDNCVKLIKTAISASDEDDEEDISRYENLIVMYEFTISMTAYGDYGSSSRDWGLTQMAKEIRSKEIFSWKSKIEEIKNKKKAAEEEAKKARIAAYWEAHADEKAKLDSERKELTDKKSKLSVEITDLNQQITEAWPTGNVPSEDESNKIKEQIRELEKQRAGLGIFAGKEKKRISEEIASLQGRVDSLKSKIEEEKRSRTAEADKTVAPLKAKKEELDKQLSVVIKRLLIIETELTKDPEM